MREKGGNTVITAVLISKVSLWKGKTWQPTQWGAADGQWVRVKGQKECINVWTANHKPSIHPPIPISQTVRLSAVIVRCFGSRLTSRLPDHGWNAHSWTDHDQCEPVCGINLLRQKGRVHTPSQGYAMFRVLNVFEPPQTCITVKWHSCNTVN